MSSGELTEGAVRALVTRHIARFTKRIEQCATKAVRMKRCSSASVEDVRGAAWVAVADPVRWRHFAMGDATTEGAEWRRIGRWFRRVLNHVCEEAARAEDMVTIYHGTRRAPAEMRVGVRVYSSGTDEPAPGAMPAGAFEAVVHEAMEIAAASTTEADVKKGMKSTANKDAATAVGKLVAERAKKAGVEKVAFDRAGFAYHGRVKALADAAREAGLQF